MRAPLQIPGGGGGETPAPNGTMLGGNGNTPPVSPSQGNSGGSGGNYPGGAGAGGGGSSYYGHPQITSGSTVIHPTPNPQLQTPNEEGQSSGTTQPGYVSGVGNAEEVASIPQFSQTQSDGGGHQGNDGYVLISATAPAAVTATTIVSNAFTAGAAPTSSRIVVFQENIESITINTDLIASISREQSLSAPLRNLMAHNSQHCRKSKSQSSSPKTRKRILTRV